MDHLFLIKVGELTLKGKNKKIFEEQLKRNVKRRLKAQGLPHRFWGTQGRFYLSVEKESREKAAEVLRNTFGIVGYATVRQVEKEWETIETTALAMLREERTPDLRSFKIEARRSDKGFPKNSYEISCTLGDALLKACPELHVDVKNPDYQLNVEIRDKAYLYGRVEPGPGGLPVGSAGKGVLLLSGGIDSPVAGYLMAKRGLQLDCLYFHTYPYTSDEAKQKVIDLAAAIAPNLNGTRLFIIPFTETQLKIKQEAPAREVTLLMRAAMVEIADKLCEREAGLCLVTGESLSQVASQTAQSIRFTGSPTTRPIFRPLVGYDKHEIISKAQVLGTYETSILPYEDCCTIFSPENPVTKPDFDRIRDSYRRLDLHQYLTEALDNAEIILLRG